MTRIDEIGKRDTNLIIPRVKCPCGWFNDTPSKKNEMVARCIKCGKLINKKARFLETLNKTKKNINAERKIANEDKKEV